MSLDGQEVLMLGPDLRVSVGQLDIKDKNHSVIKDIQIEKINSIDSIIAVIPKLTIIPNITEIVSGNLTLQGLVISDPKIDVKLGKKILLYRRKKRNLQALNSVLLCWSGPISKYLLPIRKIPRVI
ncbi:hypothetical protein [Niabella ginsengisoli]|uniref:Uncharacterized protein n=1 Tax=Niabella ginsengisoli TaxID=522298 RepID=A0ABS9SEH9_9BACT|nr:hypothetical protein [Niabella ginsengisoli]MCH5596584.1 hypothetical protein [Niabella ginsengisoli]